MNRFFRIILAIVALASLMFGQNPGQRAVVRFADSAEFLVKRMIGLTTFRDVQLFERISMG